MSAEILHWLPAVIAVLMVLDILAQSGDVAGMLRYLRSELRRAPAELDHPSAPRAAIILSLRGPDPQLKATLQALAEQQYPNFYVQVVIDSEQDPVLHVVREIQQSAANREFRIAMLTSPSTACSLKCSALIQAVNDLDADVQVVAFIDGDVVPHPTWLTELVVPLVGGEADVVGGNRWYSPPDARAGTIARYFWNAAYATGMWAQGAPWAGTMALQRKTIDAIGLLPAWSTAMSVDATLHRCLRAHNRSFKLIASLIMTNREGIGIREFQRWVTRQMAVIRYTASDTAKAAERQIGILLVLHTLLPGIAIASLATDHPGSGATAAGMLSFYWLFCSLRMILIELTMRSIAHRRNEPAGWLTPLKALMWYPGVVITHYVIGFGVLRALRVKVVDWRGISYLLSGSGRVQMTGYTPFGGSWLPDDNHSVV